MLKSASRNPVLASCTIESLRGDDSEELEKVPASSHGALTLL